MVQKPDRGRYLVLEDVRVSYNHKKNSINLTSSDPDIPNGAFHMILNKGTETEEALRDLLSENGLIKPVEAISSNFDEVETIPYQKLLSLSQEIASDIRMGVKRNLILLGAPGTGKSFFMGTLAYYSALLGSTVIYVHNSTTPLDFTEMDKIKKVNVINVLECDGILNPSHKSFSESQQQSGLIDLIETLMEPHDNDPGTDPYYRNLFLEEIRFAIMEIASSKSTLSMKTLIDVLSSQPNLSFKTGKPTEMHIKTALVERLKYMMRFPHANLFFKEGEPLKNKIKEGYVNIINLAPTSNFSDNQRWSFGNECAVLDALRNFAAAKTEEELPLAIFTDGLNESNSSKSMFKLKSSHRGSVVATYHDSGIGNDHNLIKNTSEIIFFRSFDNHDLSYLFPSYAQEDVRNMNNLRKELKIGQSIRVSPTGEILSFVNPDSSDSSKMREISKSFSKIK
jgi:hypothetical protein